MKISRKYKFILLILLYAVGYFISIYGHAIVEHSKLSCSWIDILLSVVFGLLFAGLSMNVSRKDKDYGKE